ncbi:MAG: FtsH protease activity modulator HflK [Clostridiales bacterium]|jgi:membrane protease subunit HflK|nr:FtsH protease activity modulator HflK [Clostridiales bacterium]
MDYDRMNFMRDLKDKIRKNAGKAVLLIIFIVAAFLFISQGWYTISEQENAVVTTAGKFTEVVGAGLHFKIPILQRAVVVNMTTRGMTLGYNDAAANSAASTETEFVSNMTPVDTLTGQGYEYVDTSDKLMISNDFNIVAIDFYVEWRVTDPRKYVYNVEAPMVLLNNIIQSSARDVVSSYMVDSVLTDGKTEIQTNIRDLVNEVLQEYDIGIAVANITIQDAEPPTAEVTAAFKAVEDAKQRKDTLLNEANRYYNENIPSARAEADKITKQAEAVREARINEANGQIARFDKMYGEYINNPEVTKTRMYLEAAEEIMPRLKMYIDGSDSENILKMLDVNN